MFRRPACLSALFRFLFAFGLSTQLPTIAAADDPKPTTNVTKDEVWQAVFMSGQRVGYSHTAIAPVVQDGKTLLRTSYVTQFSYKRLGQPLVLRQILNTEETIDGDLLRFYFEIANPPASSTITTGVVDGDHLILKQTVDGKVKESRQPWRNDVKSPTYQERSLKQTPLKAGESRSFEAFMPEFNSVGKITLEATDLVETPFFNGKSQRLLKVRMTQSIVPSVVVTAFADPRGELLKVSTDLLGNQMVAYQVSQDEALKTIAGAELDLAISTLVKVKPIPNAHLLRSMRYRVTSRGQKVQEVLAPSETQTVTKISDEVADVTVTAMPIPAKATIRSVGAEFLASSQYVQSDDSKVKELAVAAAGDATNPAEIARRMERYLFEKLSKKNLSTAMASAAEVARTMAGDCTEHAILLAAMLRAKGIPSRVVVGFVYVDKLTAFGAHMWTEANLDGHWIPLDATMGRGGIGAGHLRMLASSLSDEGPRAVSCFVPLVVAQLQIDVLD